MEALVASLSQDLGVTIQRAQPGTPEYMIGEACSRGEVETVERLLNEGVSVSSLDKTGRPLLTVAAAFGHTNVCRLLLERGADIHMKCIGVGLELVQINGQGAHAVLPSVPLDFYKTLYIPHSLSPPPLYSLFLYTQPSTAPRIKGTMPP